MQSTPDELLLYLGLLVVVQAGANQPGDLWSFNYRLSSGLEAFITHHEHDSSKSKPQPVFSINPLTLVRE